jgi:hypothetical protein
VIEEIASNVVAVTADNQNAFAVPFDAIARKRTGGVLFSRGKPGAVVSGKPVVEEEPVPSSQRDGKLIPVTFTVNNAVPTTFGDNIFLTGGTAELGNWSTPFDGAVGPMLAPNYPNWFLNVSVPAGQEIEFKFIKIAGNGAVTWENGPNHKYTVPASGTGFVNVTWQN